MFRFRTKIVVKIVVKVKKKVKNYYTIKKYNLSYIRDKNRAFLLYFFIVKTLVYL